jgi:hypothetical protein
MPKKKINDLELRSMLTAAKTDALSADQSTKLSSERARANEYYVGDVSRDIQVEEGQSSAVSTDVSDTVDGMMPAMMEIFCGTDEVVQFEPVGPEDVKASEQETDYVNHVFMQQNPGFNILYSMVKDALLQKVGIVKVFWESKDEVEEQTYYDLSDDQLQILQNDPEIEITHHTEKDSPGDSANGY